MRSILVLCLLALAACSAPRRAGVEAWGYFISPNGKPFRFEGAAPAARWFAAADADSDGRVTQAEFAADARGFFADVDGDANGLVTSSEVSAWRAREARELEATLALIPAPGVGERRRPRPPAWTPQSGFVRTKIREAPRRLALVTLLDEREPMLASDADFNRRVTPEEYEAATADRFRLLDLDHDGALTRGEVREFVE